MFITLAEWARQTFGDAAPPIETLRLWAQQDRIVPCPEKHGRSYYVIPGAMCLAPYGRLQLANRILAAEARRRR